MENALGAVVVLLFVVGFFGALAWLILRERRKTRERGERLAAQGFKAVNGAASELEECVQSLRARRGNRRLRLSNVYSRPIPGGMVYIYDQQESGGEDTDTRTAVLGVLAPGLNLPHFTLTPVPESMEGMSAQMGKARVVGSILLRTMDWAVAKAGFERVEYPDDPAFARRYLVLAVDPLAVDAFLTPQRRQGLCALADAAPSGRGLSVMARGDFFVLDQGVALRSAPLAPVSPLERLAVANRVLDLFL